MKREIKFRAWDDIEMVYISDLFWFEENHFSSVNDNLGHKLMQYTGLKDKNGKEIYEGDIVKGDLGHVGTVEYNAPSFEVRWNDGDCCKIFDAVHGVIEVIGNIYENPNLLTSPSTGNKTE